MDITCNREGKNKNNFQRRYLFLSLYVREQFSLYSAGTEILCYTYKTVLKILAVLPNALQVKTAYKCDTHKREIISFTHEHIQ